MTNTTSAKAGMVSVLTAGGGARHWPTNILNAAAAGVNTTKTMTKRGTVTMSKCDICGDSGIVTTEDNGGVISQDTCPMGCALPEPKVAVEDTASVADTNPVPKTNPTPKNDEPIKCHACGAILDIRAIMREKGRRAGRLGGLKMTSERARKNQAASVIARARNKAAKAKKVKA